MAERLCTTLDPASVILNRLSYVADVPERGTSPKLGMTQPVPAAVTGSEAATTPASAGTWRGASAEETRKGGTSRGPQDSDTTGEDRKDPKTPAVGRCAPGPMRENPNQKAAADASELRPEPPVQGAAPASAKRETIRHYVPRQMRGVQNQGPAAGPTGLSPEPPVRGAARAGMDINNKKAAADASGLSPEPPVQRVATASAKSKTISINGSYDEYAKTGATVWQQSTTLNVKPTVGLAAASLINHTREKAETIELQETWETPGHDDRPFIVLTETKFSFRCIPVLDRYSPYRTRV